jgi:hypothetical protein
MCASFSDGQADVAPRRLLRLADLQQATTAPPPCDRPPEEEKGKPQVTRLRLRAERRLRKPLLYPLSYEGASAQSSDLRVDPGWQGLARVDLG